MLTYGNKKYYTKDEVLSIINFHKSESNTYLKHTYNIIIDRIHKSKAKFYSIYESESLVEKFRQTLFEEIEKQYMETFNLTSMR